MRLIRLLSLIGPFLLAGFATILTCSSARAASKTLNVFIWSEYIDPAVVAEFEKSEDCKVVLDLFEDDASMVAKIRNGGASRYDVCVAPDHVVPKLSRLNLLQPLPASCTAVIPQMESLFRNPPYDPGNRFSVPYLWGTVCLYLRPAKGVVPEPTWGLVFDPAKQPGPFLLMDGTRDLLGAALKYKGYSMNSTVVSQLKEARDLAIAAKSRSQGFEGGVGGKNKVLAKTVRMSMAFSGDALRGVREDPETVCIIPKEGTQVWVDNLVICAQAPHPALAERFVVYLSSPKVSARLATFLQYATPNSAAKAFLDPAFVANPAVFPPPEVMGKLEFLKDLGKDTRLYDEIWTQIRAR